MPIASCPLPINPGGLVGCSLPACLFVIVYVVGHLVGRDSGLAYCTLFSVSVVYVYNELRHRFSPSSGSSSTKRILLDVWVDVSETLRPEVGARPCLYPLAARLDVAWAAKTRVPLSCRPIIIHSLGQGGTQHSINLLSAHERLRPTVNNWLRRRRRRGRMAYSGIPSVSSHQYF